MAAGQEGLDEVRVMQEGGFSDDEINSEVTSHKVVMKEGGFTDREVDQYYGKPPFDPSKLQQHLDTNFADFASGRAKSLLSSSEGAPLAPEPEYTPAQAEGAAPPPPKEADSFLHALEAGFQISATGLVARAGKDPDYDVSDAQSWYMGIAKQAGMVAGDIPASILGGLLAAPAGLAAGPAAPIASVMAAGAGANALPTAIRSMYMHHLSNGQVTDFKDFWTKASGVFLDTAKSAVVGGVTMGAGAKVGATIAKGIPIANTTAKLATEIATMVTVGKALDGEVPKFKDFTDAAILVAGLHGATKIIQTFRGPVPVIAENQVDNIRNGGPPGGDGNGTQPPSAGMLSVQGKLQVIYEKTGIKPSEVAQQAMKDPVLKQQLLAHGLDIPEAYKPFVDPAAEETTQKFSLPEKMGDGHLEIGKTADTSTEQAPTDTPADTLKKFLLNEGGSLSSAPEEEVVSDAEQKVLDRIGSQDKPSKMPSVDEVYTDALDNLHPIAQFVEAVTNGKEIDTKDNAYLLSRLTRGNAGRAADFIENGPRDFDTHERLEGHEGLKKILEPLAKSLSGFRAYLISARDTELIPRGIKVGEGDHEAILANAHEVLKAGKDKYEESAQKLYKFNNALTDYLVKAGIVSEESSEAFKKLHQHYIPFYRIMEEDGAKSPGKGLQVRNPIKQMLGSGRELVDPIESIIRNTFSYIELAERNRAVRALVDTAIKYGAPKELIEKIQAPLKPIEVAPEEMARFQKDFGGDGETLAQAMTIFRPIRTELARDEIVSYRDGKREVYRLPEGVAVAVKNLDGGSAGLFMKIMSAPAKALRAGTIFQPAFAIKNLIRDQVYATLFSKNGYFPFVAAMEGMAAIFKNEKGFQDWQAGGGGGANLVSMDRNYINNHVLQLDPVKGVVAKMWNVATKPIHFARIASELIENSTRVGEFMNARRRGFDIHEAAFQSREVTLDFSRMGAKTQAFNQITAFFNAQLQGLDRIGRAVKEDPVAMTAKIVATVAVPSIALWWANHDDPRWDEIPRWQKDLAWIVMTDKWTDATPSEAAVAGKNFTRQGPNGQIQINKGNIYRIPKPNEIGVMAGSLLERTLEAYTKHDPSAYKDFSETMTQSFTPAYTPTSLIPIIEQFSNKSTFTGSPIVPGHLEKGAPEVQYVEYTSETAKILGRIIAPVAPKVGDLSVASPMVIENYVRAWTGGLGSDVLRIVDEGLYKAGVVPEPLKATATLADMPIIKAFVVRYPGANSKSITDFQEKFQAHEQLLNTIKIKQAKGDIVGSMQMRMAQENQTALANIDGFHAAMGRVKQAIERVNQNPTIKPDQKRQLIDGMYFQMTQFARMGNQMVDAFEKFIQKGAKQ